MSYAFIQACRIGDEEEAKRQYDLYITDEKMLNDCCTTACYYGHLNIVQWLYSLGVIYTDPSRFVYSCYHGQEHVAKWLYSLGDVNIHDSDEAAFRYACQMGHMSIAKWLYSLGGVDIHWGQDYVFRVACVFWHINIAKWLYSLGGVDIHAHDDGAFRAVCICRQKGFALWMVSIGADPNILEEEDKNTFEKWIQEERTNVVDVLLEERGMKDVDKNVFNVVAEYVI